MCGMAGSRPMFSPKRVTRRSAGGHRYAARWRPPGWWPGRVPHPITGPDVLNPSMRPATAPTARRKTDSRPSRSSAWWPIPARRISAANRNARRPGPRRSRRTGRPAAPGRQGPRHPANPPRQRPDLRPGGRFRAGGPAGSRLKLNSFSSDCSLTHHEISHARSHCTKP